MRPGPILHRWHQAGCEVGTPLAATSEDAPHLRMHRGRDRVVKPSRALCENPPRQPNRDGSCTVQTPFGRRETNARVIYMDNLLVPTHEAVGLAKDETYQRQDEGESRSMVETGPTLTETRKGRVEEACRV